MGSCWFLEKRILYIMFLITNNYPTTDAKSVGINNESVIGRVVVLVFITTTRPCTAKVLEIIMNQWQGGCQTG